MKRSVQYKQLFEETMHILKRNLKKAQANPRDSTNLFHHSLGVLQLYSIASFGAVSAAREQSNRQQIDALIDQIGKAQFVRNY